LCYICKKRERNEANITEALTEANRAKACLQEASLSVGTNKKETPERVPLFIKDVSKKLFI